MLNHNLCVFILSSIYLLLILWPIKVETTYIPPENHHAHTTYNTNHYKQQHVACMRSICTNICVLQHLYMRTCVIDDCFSLRLYINKSKIYLYFSPLNLLTYFYAYTGFLSGSFCYCCSSIYCFSPISFHFLFC